MEEPKVTLREVIQLLEESYNDPLIEKRLLLLCQVNFSPNPIFINSYQWGSRVYGTNVEGSDWDFISVLSNPKGENHFEELGTSVTPYIGPSTLSDYEMLGMFL
jgi:hypothetical protein